MLKYAGHDWTWPVIFALALLGVAFHLRFGHWLNKRNQAEPEAETQDDDEDFEYE